MGIGFFFYSRFRLSFGRQLIIFGDGGGGVLVQSGFQRFVLIATGNVRHMSGNMPISADETLLLS
jgi:hypothetical protein